MGCAVANDHRWRQARMEARAVKQAEEDLLGSKADRWNAGCTTLSPEARCKVDRRKQGVSPPKRGDCHLEPSCSSSGEIGRRPDNCSCRQLLQRVVTTRRNHLCHNHLLLVSLCLETLPPQQSIRTCFSRHIDRFCSFSRPLGLEDTKTTRPSNNNTFAKAHKE